MYISKIFSAVFLAVVLAPAASAQPVPDLDGGDWSWSSVEKIRMPREFLEGVGAGLGIAPEGENTHAICEKSGSMTLVQSGVIFEGVATKESNACETTGGQIFQQPGVTFAIENGRINGNGAHFSFHSPTVKPCPHQVVITDVANGRATGMSGTGRCFLPGHPQWEGPFDVDPPPGGTSKTLNWEASRP